MDLTIDVEDYKLNVRAAAMIIHNNKLLVHQNINHDHCNLIGGRVEIGEDSAKTIKREVKEELGKDIDIISYVSTIENFFEKDNKKYHEILFIYKAEFKNEQDKKIEKPLENIEGKDYLKYKWIDLNELDKVKILPTILKDVINSKSYPIHKIFKWKNEKL